MEISQGVSVVIPTYNRRDDVLRCVNSVLKSDCVNFEVIVVDNASTDDTYEKLMELCDANPCLKVVLADKNLGAGGGRNLGAYNASGMDLLFLDSDNVIDSHMIRILADSIKNSGAGMVGPLMLFGERPDRIWTYFADINPWTSRAHYLGHKEPYPQSLPRFVDSGHIPNCFMVRKEDFEAIGGFDEYYVVMYEEADFAEQIKKQLGKKIVIDTHAITYHYVPFEEKQSDGCILGMRDAGRVYLLARNRVHFVKRNCNPLQKLFFFLVANLVMTFYYCYHFARAGRWDYAMSYLQGVKAGMAGR